MKIVIAGASAGIGNFLAQRLIKSGHNVWGLARSKILRPRHSRFTSLICDVANWDDVDRAADTVAEDRSWGRADALILCAARQQPIGASVTLDPQDWTQTIRVNLDGTFHMIRAFHRLLRPAEGRAKILCFSGGGATKPRPRFSAYAASKTAVVRLVETLAEEWTNDPIDINAIAPGALPTRMTEEILQIGGAKAGHDEVAAARETVAEKEKGFRRLGALVDFLLSPESDRITGKLLSAQWDRWENLHERRREIEASDIYTLRRIVPKDRGKSWD